MVPTKVSYKCCSRPRIIYMARNATIAWGISPFSWREAIIVHLLKKGKPASDIDSFRPVSLTSCVAKTMERMVANRITYLAEVNGWWSKDQAGFRSQRS